MVQVQTPPFKGCTRSEAQLPVSHFRRLVGDPRAANTQSKLHRVSPDQPSWKHWTQHFLEIPLTTAPSEQTDPFGKHSNTKWKTNSIWKALQHQAKGPAPLWKFGNPFDHGTLEHPVKKHTLSYTRKPLKICVWIPTHIRPKLSSMVLFRLGALKSIPKTITRTEHRCATQNYQDRKS